MCSYRIFAYLRCRHGDVMSFQIWDKQFTSKELAFMSDASETASSASSISSINSTNSQFRRFYRMWCLKESIVKALGVGIDFNLQSFEFSVHEEDETIKVNNEFVLLFSSRFLLRTLICNRNSELTRLVSLFSSPSCQRRSRFTKSLPSSLKKAGSLKRPCWTKTTATPLRCSRRWLAVEASRTDQKCSVWTGRLC